jgi:hypothetical protein
VLRVPKTFRLTLASGQRLTCADAASLLAGTRRGEVRSAGKGSKGERWYAWSWLATGSPQHCLLIRRHLGTGELAFHYCYVPVGQLLTLTRLIAAAGLRWPVKRLTLQLAAGVDGLGEPLARHFLEVWDEQARLERLLALMRSVPADDRSASMFAEFVEREIVARLGDTIGGPDANLRAELIGSHLLGLALMRYILRLEPLAAVPPQTIAAWMGPTLQHYISGTL